MNKKRSKCEISSCKNKAIATPGCEECGKMFCRNCYKEDSELQCEGIFYCEPCYNKVYYKCEDCKHYMKYESETEYQICKKCASKRDHYSDETKEHYRKCLNKLKELTQGEFKVQQFMDFENYVFQCESDVYIDEVYDILSDVKYKYDAFSEEDYEDNDLGGVDRELHPCIKDKKIDHDDINKLQKWFEEFTDAFIIVDEYPPRRFDSDDSDDFGQD